LYGRGYQQQVRFGPPHTPDVIKTLMLANLACFLIQLYSPMFSEWFAATPSEFWSGQVWQAFTYMWLHGGWFHLGANMLSLWMFGSPMASAWGAERFVRFYLLCGLGAGILIVALPAILLPLGVSWSGFSGWHSNTLGASGAVIGVLVAYSLTWPDRTIMLLIPPVPIKAIWLIPVLFALEFFGPFGGNVSHLGHLGGALTGWILFRREHGQPVLPSKDQLIYRWRRYKMRRQLHEVRREQQRNWRDDSRLH
jgi:membrane associated rhomboid family serine protease